MRKRIIFVVACLVVLTTIMVFKPRKKPLISAPAAPTPTVYKTKQDCEQASGKSCMFSYCDYKCQDYYKGWIVKD